MRLLSYFGGFFSVCHVLLLAVHAKRFPAAHHRLTTTVLPSSCSSLSFPSPLPAHSATFIERVSTDTASLASGLLLALSRPAFCASIKVYPEPRADLPTEGQRKRLSYCQGLLWNIATDLFDAKRFDAARRVFSALGSDLSEHGDAVRARAARANSLCCLHGGDVEGAASFIELAGECPLFSVVARCLHAFLVRVATTRCLLPLRRVITR